MQQESEDNAAYIRIFQRGKFRPVESRNFEKPEKESEGFDNPRRVMGKKCCGCKLGSPRRLRTTPPSAEGGKETASKGSLSEGEPSRSDWGSNNTFAPLPP